MTRAWQDRLEVLRPEVADTNVFDLARIFHVLEYFPSSLQVFDHMRVVNQEEIRHETQTLDGA